VGQVNFIFFVLLAIGNGVDLGGVLLACAEFGSYVVGSEFDWRVLTAQGNLFEAIRRFLLFNV
jgi:tRNA G10  N-methylase Trm11